MTQNEFAAWREFFNDSPFDDLHRYHRPAALVATSLGGGDFDRVLDFLAPPPDDGFTDADRDLFRAAGLSKLGAPI